MVWPCEYNTAHIDMWLDPARRFHYPIAKTSLWMLHLYSCTWD